MKPGYWPKLLPGDNILLKEDYPPDRYLTSVLEGFVPPAHIVHGSAILGESLSSVVERLEKFEKLGLILPEINKELICEIEVSDDDVIALID